MDKTVTSQKKLKVVDADGAGAGGLDDIEGPIQPVADKPNRAEAEDAVRTLIKWAGDDPATPTQKPAMSNSPGAYRSGMTAVSPPSKAASAWMQPSLTP